MNDLTAPSSSESSVTVLLARERRARDLMSAVAVQAGAERHEDGVLRRVLGLVCAHAGWPLAHCYVVDADGTLVSSGIWVGAADPRFDAFVAQTRATTFRSGEGLPGRVLAGGRPSWITDVAIDGNFPRAPSYLAVGLGAAFGFPAGTGDEVLAVLEFFADHPEPPDASLLEVLQAIGSLTGQQLLRCRAEAALRSSEARFRAVTDSASDAVIAADMTGQVTFWNGAAERMLGHEARHMLGQPLETIIPPELRGAHQAGMKRLRERGENRLIGLAVEVEALRADGSLLPVELTLGHKGEGAERLVTAVLRDITDRKAAEARLAVQAEELRRQHAALQRSHAELVEAQRLMERIFSAYAEILPGTLLDGRYRLEEAIGSGGFGVVYRARELATERPVAIKLFRPASGRVSPEQLRRFQREGPAMLRVRHKNAVTLLDTGVSADGLPYLVMELLQGLTLAGLINRSGPLAPRRAAEIAADVADALSAVHAAGLVHRDIKPENVFLHSDGAATVTRILDFGIALTLDGPEEERLTHTGRWVGTPAWIAPERLGGEPGDDRSDVWSATALLYHAISGQPPFPRTVHFTAMDGQKRLVPLSSLDPRIPPELDAIVLRGLAFLPEARPSAAELAAALRAVSLTLPEHGVTLELA